MRKLSVVIAAYDEEDNVEPLLRRLHAVLAAMRGWHWEVVFVVEGGDRTREILERLARELMGDVRVLYQRQPSGLGNAFRRGFAAVAPDADVVVTLDADLNHQPEEIPRLVAALERSGADVLIGSRFLAGSAVEGTPLWKRFLSGVMNSLMRYLYGLRVRDKTSGFRVYRAEALRRVSFRLVNFAFLPELLIRLHAAGYRIVEEPIRFVFRQQGRSKLAFWPTTFSYLALLKMRFNRWSLAALGLILLGVGIRLAAEFPVHKYPADADALGAGLCIERVLRGETPVFYHPERIGSLECHLGAPLLYFTGPSRAALAMVPVVEAGLLLVVCYRWTRRVLGQHHALLALLFFAVPAPAVLFWTYMPNSYPMLLLLCAAVLWLSGRVAPGDGPAHGLALGLAVGLGLWHSLLTLPCSVPAVVTALARRRPAPTWIAALAAGVVVGAAPLLVYYLMYRLPFFTGNMGAEPAEGAATMLENLTYLLRVQLPELVASTDPEGGVVPPGSLSRWLRGPVLAVHAAALVVLLVLPLRRAATPPRLRALWWVALGVLAATAGAYVASAAGSLRGLNVRYVLPLYLFAAPALALLIAWVGQWRRLAAVVLAAVVLVFNLAGYRWPDHPRRRQLRELAAADRELTATLARRDVDVLLGSHWTVLPVDWLSGGRVVGIACEQVLDFDLHAKRLGRGPYRWAAAAGWPGRLKLAAWLERLEAPAALHHVASYAVVLPREPLRDLEDVRRALAECPVPVPGP